MPTTLRRFAYRALLLVVGCFLGWLIGFVLAVASASLTGRLPSGTQVAPRHYLCLVVLESTAPVGEDAVRHQRKDCNDFGTR